MELLEVVFFLLAVLGLIGVGICKDNCPGDDHQS